MEKGTEAQEQHDAAMAASLDQVDRDMAAREVEPPAQADGQAAEFLDDVAAALELEDEGQFDDLSEIMEVEHREQLGVRIAWPALRGAFVTIAHISAAQDKKNALERKFREKKGWGYDRPLPPAAEEALWRESLCGTVVRHFEGIKLGGNVVPWSESGYRKLIGVRRFRVFVLRQSRNMENWRRASMDDARGKS